MYSFQKLISAFKLRMCYDGRKNYALFFSFLAHLLISQKLLWKLVYSFFCKSHQNYLWVTPKVTKESFRSWRFPLIYIQDLKKPEFDEFLLLFFRDWYWHQKEIEHRLFNLCETMAPPPLLSHHHQQVNINNYLSLIFLK